MLFVLFCSVFAVGIILLHSDRQRGMHFRQIGMNWAEDLTKQLKAGRGRKARKKGGDEINVHSAFHSKKQLTIIITHLALQLRIQVALHQTPTQATVVIKKYSTPWRTEET